MNYTLLPIPSLQHIAITEMTIALWNHDDIRTLIRDSLIQTCDLRRLGKWAAIENKVLERALQLQTPGALKEVMTGFVKPVGSQILNWIEYHGEYIFSERKLPDILCWTSRGTIDAKRTAELLVKDESVDIALRFELACNNCLEDDIPKLRSELPKPCAYLEGPIIKDLVILWTCYLQGEMSGMNDLIETCREAMCSPYQYAFEMAAKGGNKVATEYIFQKLTASERKDCLVKAAKDSSISQVFRNDDGGYYGDVLCFLLAQMDEEQQMNIFKRCPYAVLTCLLDGHRQSFFIETANRMWDFLMSVDSDECCEFCLRVLRCMISKVRRGHKDYDYQKLFGEFWQQIPNSVKKCIIDKGACVNLLFDLFFIKDEKNIDLILEDANDEEKRKLIGRIKEISIRNAFGLHDQMRKFKEKMKEFEK